MSISSSRGPLRPGIWAVFAWVCLSPWVAWADTAKTKPPALTPEQRQKNLDSFEEVWRTVRDKHWDPKLGGLNWQAIHDEYKPKVEKAETTAQARAAMRAMLGRLGQSHFGIIPAEVYDTIKKGSGGADKEKITPVTGLDLRVVDGLVLVVRVDAELPAAKLGIHPGWVVLEVKGAKLAPVLEKIRKTYKDSPKLELEQLIALRGLLGGKVDEKVEVTFRDGDDKEVKLAVPLARPSGTRVQLGHLPPFYLRYKAGKVDETIGYFGLSGFFDPPRVMKALEETVLANLKSDGFIIDLRGNPGGIGIMAVGFGNWFVPETDRKLGTLRMRDTTLNFVLNLREETFTGPLAILVDGMSGSTSEILAGGLQDLKRARVFGTRTMGAALPSVFTRLPNGDGFQYAFANYVSVGGQALEGRGVTPDETVVPDRRALLGGRDPVQDAAVRWIRAAEKGGPVTDVCFVYPESIFSHRLEAIPMTYWTCRGQAAAALAAVLLLTGQQLSAQELPKGEEIMDKFVEASGGKAAHLKIKNLVAKGTLSVPAAGLEGPITIYQAAPAKLYFQADLPGVGKTEEGVSDGVVWERSATTGAKLKTVLAREKALLEAQMHADVNWRELFTKATCVGEEEVEGKSAFKVELTPTKGKMVTKYFDKKSGLVVKQSQTAESALGEIKVDVYVSDYRKQDGLLFARSSKIVMLGMDVLLKLDTVTFNADIPATRFELPADVKRLVEKEKTK